MNLTTKERSLLEDQKTHEEVCIQKYSNYTELATDPQLKQVFTNNGNIEKEHLNTVNQLLSGQVPKVGQQSGGSQGSSSNQSSTTQSKGTNQSTNTADITWSQGNPTAGNTGNAYQGTSMRKETGSSTDSLSVRGETMQRSTTTQNTTSSLGSDMMTTSGIPSGRSNASGINVTDKDLCTDLLMTEKYVSGAYDTAIFEFRDPQVREVLNHIQKEEQQHGEAIFKYMESAGLYEVQQ